MTARRTRSRYPNSFKRKPAFAAGFLVGVPGIEPGTSRV